VQSASPVQSGFGKDLGSGREPYAWRSARALPCSRRKAAIPGATPRSCS
jgi:hypothetical protein